MGSCADGITRSNDWFDPVGWFVQNKCYGLYTNHPVLGPVAFCSANAFLGLIKPVLVPPIAAVGLVAMPIIATVKACQGKYNEAKTWGVACLMCGVALAGIAAFMVVSAFYMTLLQGTITVVVGISISIVIHVYRVAKTPKLPGGPDVVLH